MKNNKFDALKRDDLLKLCVELEDELRTLRPPPARFKVGQALAYGLKNPWLRGQPTLLFVVLSVENLNGEWYYGHSRNGPHGFAVYSEKHLRALSSKEKDGSELTAEEQQNMPAVQAVPTIAGHNGPVQMGHVGQHVVYHNPDGGIVADPNWTPQPETEPFDPEF